MYRLALIWTLNSFSCILGSLPIRGQCVSAEYIINLTCRLIAGVRDSLSTLGMFLPSCNMPYEAEGVKDSSQATSGCA